MRRLLLPSLLACAFLFAAACGGGNEDRSAGIIHRLLLSSQPSESGTLESFVGRLPDGLSAAETPPQFPGADLIVSSRQAATREASGLGQPASQAAIYLIVLDTDAARPRVFAFYEEALDKEPWQLEASASTEELDTLEFSNPGNLDISGVVTIARGGEDERTTILVSLRDAGARQEELPFELAASLPIPRTFPPDVPVYQGATITGTLFLREPGNENFFLVFLTTDGQDAVVEFYRQTFEGQGWTVEGDTLGLADRISFEDAERDLQGEVFVDRFSQDRQYTEVVIQLRVNPAREPADGAEVPAQ